MHRFVKCAAGPGLAAALLVLAPSARSAPPVAAASSQDQAAKLDELVNKWNDAQKAFADEYRKAKTEAERTAVLEKQPKAADHLPGFIEVAEQSAGTETAAKAWMWVLRLSGQAEDDEVTNVAIEALMRDHVSSKEIGELPGLIGSMLSRKLGVEKSEAMLRELIAKTQAPAVKGAALYSLAALIDEQEPEAGSERAKEVRTLMESVAQDYADVKDARGRPIGKRAEGWLFEKDHLQVGNTAPEVEATDLSGVAFKLSDYRGKVVLLDFWGNW